MPASGIPRRDVSRRRLSRWVLRVCLAGLAVVAALATAAVLVLAHGLDRPWIKRRLISVARSSAGVDVDYRSLRVELFSGAEIDGLVVASPDEVRGLAPSLARMGRVEARWSLASLFGHGPQIQRLAASDVTLTVVVDEHGRTSFDALPSSPSPPSPPLSKRAAVELATAPPVGRLDVDRVTLTVIRSEQGREVERTDVQGAALALSAEPATQGWRVRAGLGAQESPLDLAIARRVGSDPSGAARAKLWLTLDATPSSVDAAVDLHVLEQTFAPSLPGDDRLHAEAALRFDPAAGKTEIALREVRADDAAVAAEASIEVPDVGDPVVRHAQGDVDVVRVLTWVPAGLVPVTAERARVRFKIDSLVLGSLVHLAGGGSLTVDAELAGVKTNLGARPVEVSAATVSLRGEQGPDGAISGVLRSHVEELKTQGASPLTASGGDVELHVGGLALAREDPLATRGDVTLSAAIATIDVRARGQRIVADGLTLRGHTLLTGHVPYAVEGDAPMNRLRVLGAGGAVLVDAPARFQVGIRDAFPDLDHPASSRAALSATADLGDIHASLEATKGADAVDFSGQVGARTLRAMRPWLTSELVQAAPWDRMSVTARSSGRVEHLSVGLPELRQDGEVHVEHPAFGAIAARSLSLTLRTRGTAVRQEADADLRTQALALEGGDASDDHVVLSATVDRDRPSLLLHVASEGRATAKLSASLSFDRSAHAVPFDVEAHLAGLAALAPLASRMRGLEGVDLSKLEVDFSSRGTALGVVAGVGRDGTFDLEPHPARTAVVEGEADMRVAHARWTRADMAVSSPGATWHAEMHGAGARRTLISHLAVEALHLGLGRREADLTGISDDANATVTGDLLDPQIELTQHAEIRTVRQDSTPGYPIGGVELTMSAEREPDGLLHIPEMKLVNGEGGTNLDLTGAVEVGAGRHRMSLQASVLQDLAPISGTPERFAGRGRVGLVAKVESRDLVHFVTHLHLKAEDVHARIAQAGLDVQAFNGDIPVTAALRAGTHGFELDRDERQNPYSMLRFADQHPLMDGNGFLSIGSLKTPWIAIERFVGSLAVAQNIFSLRQFEMGVRGGTVTGQCALDWHGAKSTIEVHVRAAGVQSSHGEPFDGNMAVTMAASDRTVQGRAEILRIGPRHLLDLLDLEDPLRVDPAMNRIRGALAFGYPDRLRLVFDHGFASARLELGGLARLISIDEIHGIPMGPIVDKFLAPVLDSIAGP